MARFTAVTAFIGLAFFACVPQVFGVGEEEYEAFNIFCIDNFGAESEVLTYQTFGSSLTFIETGFWIHRSENSASIAYETNLPARGYIEFGPTPDFGQTTSISERSFYLHLHYLTELVPHQEYHYRLVAVDERGNTLYSDTYTFQTQTVTGSIYIPGDLGSPPYILNKAGATYVLTDNIDAETRAFTVAAANVTLDLNGHTVTYDSGPPLVSGTTWDQYVYSDISTFGVYSYGSYSGKLVNGTISQGESNSTGTIGLGFNPVYIGIRSGSVFEIAGITTEWAGHSVSGIVSRGGDNLIHHNIILDTGTGIDNRHQGIKAIDAATGGTEVHHNLVKRSRHQGVVLPWHAASNEVYIDSWATNSYGIKPRSNTTVEDNKVFGTGYHNVAMGWSLADTDWLNIRNNFIYVVGDAPNNRSTEYGAHSSVNGMRLTQYGGATLQYNNYLYDGNVVIVKGKNGCQTMRGVQFFSDPYVSNLIFRNNTIKTEVMDDVTDIAPCVVGHGLSDRAGTWLPVLYENNNFITNSVHVRFGDSYQSGGNHHFKNCSFEQFDNRPDYRTIQIGYWNYHSYGNLFIDGSVSGGADLENNSFVGDPGGTRDYAVGHTLFVTAHDIDGNPLADSSIEVQDERGTTLTVQTDAKGNARLELMEFTYAAAIGASTASKTTHHDHTVYLDGYLPMDVTTQMFDARNDESTPILLIFRLSASEPSPGPPTIRPFGES